MQNNTSHLMRMSKIRLRSLLVILPLAFLAIFFFYPLGAIFQLAGSGGLAEVAGDPYYWRVIGFSAWLGAISAVLTLLVALPGAYVFARLQFPGKSLVRAVATVPFVLPTVVVAAAFSELLGPRGLLNATLGSLGLPAIQVERTISLVLLAHVFYNYSVVLRIVGVAWQGLDARLDQAAAVLGASRWRVLREVTLPLLIPAIGAAALLVFIYCFASFGIVLILGGPRMATVEVEIYRQTAQLLRLDIAAALALVQILATIIATLLYNHFQRRTSVTLAARRIALQRPRRAANRALVAANVAFILLLIGLPLLALVLRSITASTGELTWNFYTQLGKNATNSLFFVPPLLAIRNSLMFAAATVALTIIVGVPAAYLSASQWTTNKQRTTNNKQRTTGNKQRTTNNGQQTTGNLLALAFTLPLGTSAVTLGLGYIVALGPLGWLRSPWMVPVAHTLLAFPFMVRGLAPAIRSLDPRMREAAQALGAGPLRVLWEIDLPLLAPALLVGAVYAFTISLGDFGAALLLGQAEFPTVPLVIFRLLGRPGGANYGQAMALCTILMVISVVCFLVMERGEQRVQMGEG